jgi:hypothetical protein
MEEDTEKKGWALETECHDEIHAADAAEAAKIAIRVYGML